MQKIGRCRFSAFEGSVVVRWPGGSSRRRSGKEAANGACKLSGLQTAQLGVEECGLGEQESVDGEGG